MFKIKPILGQKNLTLTVASIFLLVAGTFFAQACGAREAMDRAANEAATIKLLQTLAVNERLYNKQHKGNAYGTFDQLIMDVNLDKRFAGDAPVVNGYIFTIKITPKANGQPAFYAINADPQKSDGLGATGKNHYYVDANLDNIKVNNSRPAGPDDAPVGQ